MTTVIMLFILPLGILLLFFDKKTQKENRALFDHYVEKILASELSDKDKINKIDAMYYENGYTIVYTDKNEFEASKKHFNLGLLLIFFGIANYFGPILYFIYYRFFLKPDRIQVKLA
ncbi:MAG: hypothetical protein PF439_04730 [Helicobacteraceae bacterium]|jgi:hypothetical protein|nr:hypothetical protein [Helicobacteraceae bacterium]